MKVVLLQDVPKIGKKLEIKEVAPGYANFLMKMKQVVPATKDAVIKARLKAEANAEEKKIKNELLMNSLKSLIGKKVKIEAKVSEGGGLYAKIHREEILGAIKDQLSIEVPISSIELEKPLDKAGEYVLNVAGVKGSFEVIITPLGQ